VDRSPLQMRQTGSGKCYGAIPPVIALFVSFALQSPLPLIGVSIVSLILVFVLRHRIRQHFSGALLILGLTKIARTPLERTYASIVAELSKAKGETEESTAYALLGHVNGLVASGSQLEARLMDIRRTVGEDSLKQLESELRELQARAMAAKDPDARTALLQSADICAGCIENTQALHALEERLSAQLELVFQTLTSVQTSFLRMRNAPEGITGASVEKIAEMVNGIQGQTRAVEQAVAEVMQLRTP
jgi:uncharacterized membrane protein YccC